MNTSKRFQSAESLYDVAETMAYAIDALDAAVHVKKKLTGRPPKVKRENVRALYRILVSLIDDLDDFLEKLSPDPDQVCMLVDAINKIVDMRKKYTIRVNSLTNLGIVPDELLKGTEYDKSRDDTE
jgi:DNA repair ATPase RecN